MSFGLAMAQETEGRVLDRNRLRQGIQAVLDSSTRGYYVVCELQDPPGPGIVIGQVLITYEWSDWRNGNFWWIQSVYVHPEWRRQGVYRRMHEYILQSARERSDVCGVRLYVEAHNKTAQRAYRQVGLTPAGYLVLEKDFVLPRDDARQFMCNREDNRDETTGA